MCFETLYCNMKFKTQIMTWQHGHEEKEFDIEQLREYMHKQKNQVVAQVYMSNGQSLLLRQPEQVSQVSEQDIREVLIGPCIVGG